MWKRKPETIALSVALAGTLTVLTVFLGDLLLTRQRDMRANEQRVQHFGLMMAEHTARSFGAVDVLLREMVSDLTVKRRDWESWAPATGWEYVTQRHSQAMPQLRDLIVFDRQGQQRFNSSFFPPPNINVTDRSYFQTLANGAEATTSGPYIGRNTGRYTYAIARRLNGPSGNFAGVAFAAIDPGYLQDFCWSNRLSDDFETVLLNAKEQIVASCRPTDVTRQSPILGATASSVLFAGKLAGHIPAEGLSTGNGLLISTTPVPGFADLRILTAVPEETLLANWNSRLFELGTVALFVSAVLLIGGLLIRRQLRDMRQMTAELAASHDHLEERVLAATSELASERDAAERANTAKSRFLAAASHDLRQPMHALALFATDLQRQVKHGATAELPHLAEQIVRSTATLGELLDSLLDLSRLDVDGVKPARRATPLQPIFDRLACSFQRDASERLQTLRFRPCRQWVDSDPQLLERMLANLLANAIRYTPNGGRILVGARPRDGDLLIEVRDSGIGIAPEHQAAIFAEFYQVGNPAREHHKGLGLGLSIVDRLAKGLGITVTLRSRPGQGTTFALRVPVATASDDDPPAAVPSAGEVHCIGDSATLRACGELIATWDYQVSYDAGRLDKRLPASAVLLVDGQLATTVAGLKTPETPLIVLTAETDLAVPAGAHRLPLPLRPAKLRALLNQLQKTLSKSMP